MLVRESPDGPHALNSRVGEDVAAASVGTVPVDPAQFARRGLVMTRLLVGLDEVHWEAGNLSVHGLLLSAWNSVAMGDVVSVLSNEPRKSVACMLPWTI